MTGQQDGINLQPSHQQYPVDLDEMTRRVLSVFQESAQHAMVRITPQGTDVFPVLKSSSRELEQVLYIIIQHLIQSSDGSHVRDLVIDFSIQEKAFCMRFAESSFGNPDQPSTKITAGLSKVFAETDEQRFSLSILKGIIEGYAGTFMMADDSRNGRIYEIRLPLAEADF